MTVYLAGDNYLETLGVVPGAVAIRLTTGAITAEEFIEKLRAVEFVSLIQDESLAEHLGHMLNRTVPHSQSNVRPRRGDELYVYRTGQHYLWITIG